MGMHTPIFFSTLVLIVFQLFSLAFLDDACKANMRTWAWRVWMLAGEPCLVMMVAMVCVSVHLCAGVSTRTLGHHTDP